MNYGNFFLKNPLIGPQEYTKFSEKQHRSATESRYLVKMNTEVPVLEF